MGTSMQRYYGLLHLVVGGCVCMHASFVLFWSLNSRFYTVLLGDDGAANSTQYPRISWSLYKNRYMRTGKVWWVHCGVHRHPAEVKKAPAGDISDFWWLGTGGKCLKMSRWLRACWAVPGTQTTVHSPAPSLSHRHRDLRLTPAERHGSLDTDQAAGWTTLPPSYEADTLPHTWCSSILSSAPHTYWAPLTPFSGLASKTHTWVKSGSSHSFGYFIEYSQNPTCFSLQSLQPTSHVHVHTYNATREKAGLERHVSKYGGQKGDSLSARVGHRRLIRKGELIPVFFLKTQTRKEEGTTCANVFRWQRTRCFLGSVWLGLRSAGVKARKTGEAGSWMA